MSSINRLPVVDTHHHLWDLSANYYPWLTDRITTRVCGEYSAIRKNYLLEDFFDDAEDVNLVKSIHVQAEHDHTDPVRETRWLQKIADLPSSRGFPHGIIAFADLSRLDVEANLEAHSSFQNVRGIRQMLHESMVDPDNPIPPLFENSTWRKNLSLLEKYGFSFDLQVYPQQMDQACELVREHPDLQFILCHTGQPSEHDEKSLKIWRTGMQALAEYQNVYVKELVKECKESDAVLLAAIGLPDVRLPDGTEVQPHQVVGLRKALDLYAAIRPIKLYAGVPSVLRDVGPGIDFIVLRENTEGLFASFGGGSAAHDQAVADTMLITRKGTERVVEFAFRLAKRRKGRPLDGRRMVTCVDKANVFRSLAFFRKIFYEVAARHADIAVESCYVDAMSLYMVQAPWNYDVLVMENMFGDILSDLGAGLVGGLGLGPSAEIGDQYALFQPSHGSAPQITGMNTANPLATILSAAMMLDWLGERKGDADVTMAARRIESAVAKILRAGKVLTPDLGGKATTTQMGDAILKDIESGRDIRAF